MLEARVEILDQILHDSMNLATIIPKDKFQCMESLRARLYCNIACVLLQLDGRLQDRNEIPKIEDETLKESSEMAKKALEIYDGMLNFTNGASNEESMREEADNSSVNFSDNSKEWDQLLKENPNLLEEDDSVEAEEYDQTVHCTSSLVRLPPC